MRLLAAIIDALTALVLAALLSSTIGWFFAERAVIAFRLHSPDTIWNGPIPLVLGAVSPLSYGYAFALLCILAGEAVWGASLGKALVGRRIVCRDPNASTNRQRFQRWLAKAAPWWVFCVALLTGWWPLVALAAALALLAFADLLTARYRRQPLWHDRVAQTSVA